ncbi:hypothetical protein UFOVP1351_9 [uncultured Caudovirales phage]|uniref:Uncharacterized protein n=1 Tax=uncultured Caudovirales phage TaxID=2100421 RepID=A0A6J5S0K3_9CAUD|nr:hypothetical protein UFOVP1351_9 [uncultured Caudovirales phage]
MKRPVTAKLVMLGHEPGVEVIGHANLISFEKAITDVLGETVREVKERIVAEVTKELSEKLKTEIIAQIDQRALANVVLAKVAGEIARELK